MTILDRKHLLAERRFLQTQLDKLPPTARLTRGSTEVRLRSVEQQLRQLPEAQEPARATLTFNGAPVLGTRGIFADFAMAAVQSFSEVVATVAASLEAPLAMMGPIPNKGQNQLLITDKALGSFGFVLEEHQGAQLSLEEDSPVAVALDRTRNLLQGTIESDDELADIASETDPRALEKLRTYLKVLIDFDAVCTLIFRGRAFRFSDVGQVKSSWERLGSDNIRESKEILEGQFLGVLPHSRTFEFELASSGSVLRGKVASSLAPIESINDHLHEQVSVEVVTTRVGGGRPRYLLQQMPRWSSGPEPGHA